MKLKIKNLTFLLMLFALISCNQTNNNTSENHEFENAAAYQSVQFEVEGMTCTGCEQTIKANIEKLEGVQSAEASHVDKIAVVKLNPSETDTTAVIDAIISSGYKVTGLSIIE